MPKFRKKKFRKGPKQEMGVKTQGDISKGHVSGKRGEGYDDIIKSNPSFESFYKGQKIVPEEEWEQFMNILKDNLPATFRITGYRSHASALLGIIKSQYFNDLTNSELGGEPKCLSWYPDGLAWQLKMSRIIIRKSESLAKLHTFLVSETESGNISRQEAVSMIPPIVLDVKSHHMVLDLCAAPGSKTAQLIEMMHAGGDESVPKGVVVANDMDNRRCYMLVHQAKRLQSPCFIITNHDASIYPGINCKNNKGEVKKMLFDRVLCDVPCSGDGTIRKNYEVWKKWNVANANNLHHLQLKILKRGLELLAVGGKLVYSTCSMNPVENEAVIAAMLKQCQGAVELINIRENLPGLKVSPGLYTWNICNRKMETIESVDKVPVQDQTQIKESMFPPSAEEAAQLKLENCIRILPHHQDTGCFFVAVLVKKNFLPWQKVSEGPEPEVLNDNITEVVTFSRKKRKVMGYKEDPFFFFKENDPAWVELRDFYKMENFPDTQLLTRCETGKKRNIYFVSSAVKNIVENNSSNIKIINTGLRLFCRSDNKGPNCNFRVTQEGVPFVVPFIKSRILEITKEDLAHLLTKEYPPVENMVEETRARLENYETGSVIIVLNTTDLLGNELKIELCGWKGKQSLRCYVPRGERLHYLRLCNVDISKYETNPNKKYKYKNAEDANEENGSVIQADDEKSPDQPENEDQTMEEEPSED